MNENPFDSQALDDDQKNRIEILRGAFKDLYATFADYLCGSRYTSLAVTALEEAAMWANKSIAFEADIVEKAQVEQKCCGSGQCSKE